MQSHRKLFAHFAKDIGCRALILQYRYAPEHQYPAQLEDTLNAYRWLLDQGIKPNHIAFIGDSAGGNLCITTMLLARDKGLPPVYIQVGGDELLLGDSTTLANCEGFPKNG